MQIKDTFARLDETKRQQMGEVLRFVIVGIIATLLQYGIYSALILQSFGSANTTIFHRSYEHRLCH